MILRFLFLFHFIHGASAAFSLNTVVSGYGYIQQNVDRTWCYYPVSGATRAVACGGDYTRTLTVHLNQTSSIGYYRPDGSRSGGSEWPVPPTNPGLVFVCASGRAQDGTYQTACAIVTTDNSFPSPGCAVAAAQPVVADGCYEPGGLPYPSVVGTQTVTSLPVAGPGRATVTSTVTRTITPLSSFSPHVHRRWLRVVSTVMTFVVVVLILLI